MAAEARQGAGGREDPYRAYNFKLIIRGKTEAHFTYCSPLAVRVESIPYREGGNHQVVHQLPGQPEYAEVTLHYGLTASRELFDWMMAIATGHVQRTNVSIALLDTAASKEKVRWNLLNAWPREWRGTALSALESHTAIATLTLVYEGLELAEAAAAEGEA